MINIIFILLALFSIGGAIVMLISKSPMNSALGTLVTMLSVAGFFALLNSTFLFLVQIIVYAGAIMTLILFILMFLNIKDSDLPKEPKKYKLIAFGAVVMLPLNILILNAINKLPSKDFSILTSDFGEIKPLGMQLYNNWLLSFELVSILLLVALIGAVVLAKKRDSKLKNAGDKI